ncbi:MULTISPECIES: hypothetical protein [unclassified Enterococcus]|uniref:Uncharacterized protein n=1 Tax=Candidatus Enterococcus dunnyi TaxID=1834192 RepID=A0A200IZQ7_9ENTE|nr:MULTISPECIES: hypothetical protein [unclassified Enterococcus]OUZ30466.1 hypothetical protein A5889_002754 [Enterococcus sp. 9D6_DIV0238]
MIGITLVEESNHVLRNVEDAALSDIVKEDVSIEELSLDTYDFDTNTFLDLLEYTEFQEYTDYIFVNFSKSKRVPKIISFLNTFSESTRFHSISIEDGGNFADQYVDRTKLQNYEKKSDSSELILKNGLMALFTGIYPRIFRKNIIKHIYFEQLSDVEHLHSSVYLNCAINHGLYIDELEKDWSSEIPSIITFKDSLQTFSKESELEECSEKELLKQLENFQENGTIAWQERKNGIIDYAQMLSLGLERRLFIYTDGIYLDYQRTSKLSSLINSTFSEIELANSRLSHKNKKNGLYEVYPLLVSIAKSLEDMHLTFITPFNKHRFDSIQLENYPSEWIVFSASDTYFALHVPSNRTFEVNQLFVEIFEAQIKECIELAKSKNGEITDTVIEEQKELMLSV